MEERKQSFPGQLWSKAHRGLLKSPAVGIEPTTARLTAACSTTELDRNLCLKTAKRRQKYRSNCNNRHDGGSARRAWRWMLSRASFWFCTALEVDTGVAEEFAFVDPRASSCRRSRLVRGWETAPFSRRAFASALQLFRSPRER